MSAQLEDRPVTAPEPTDRQTDPAFLLHRGGKIEVRSTVPLESREDLSLAYTPGVARVCTAIAEDRSLAYEYTWKSHTVAVVTDGTAVLGLGDIGPEAALPVMEGKALLFKHFGDVDAVPICLDVTDIDALVDTVARLAPAFGGINLEDISRRGASRSSGGCRRGWTSPCSTTTSTARPSSCSPP
jgi:malate dehydrogenase (oxaloacetate-decarboxylating)